METASPAGPKQPPAHTTAPATTHKTPNAPSLEQGFTATYALRGLWAKTADTSDTRGRSRITEKQRARMVDWMFEVTGTLARGEVELAVSAFCRAVLLMDLFTKHHTQRRLGDADVHLLGLACLFLAGKYEDMGVRLRVFSRLAGHDAFAPGEICRMEAEILHTLGFNLSFATPFDVLRALAAEGRRRAAAVAGCGRRLVFEASPQAGKEDRAEGSETRVAHEALVQLQGDICADVFTFSAYALLLTLHHSLFNDFSPLHRVLACVVRALRHVLRLCMRLPAVRAVGRAEAERLFREQPFVAFLLGEAEGHLHSRFLVPRVDEFVRNFSSKRKLLLQVRRNRAYSPAALRLPCLLGLAAPPGQFGV
mgnify:CR=1 FL=1